MKIIAHRGLIDGPNKELENHPDTIKKALDLGFDVEVDIWFKDGNWYLGHDEPQYPIGINYLMRNANAFWIHAKNIDAMYELLQATSPLDACNFFWHQNDDVTLTRKGKFLWTYSGKQLTPYSICVLPEAFMNLQDTWTLKCYGICTDYAKLVEGLCNR